MVNASKRSVGVSNLTRALSQRYRRVTVATELLRAIGPRDTLRRVRQELELRGAPGASRDQYVCIWRDAAQALDAHVTDFGGGFLEISRGMRRTRVRGRLTALDGEVTLRLVRDKTAVNRLLRAAGIHLPEHAELEGDDLHGARHFMARCPPPWVVKPAGTSGGQGITTGLHTWEDFEMARRRALLDGSRLILERQVVGDVYRLLILDGEVIDVLRRLPSRVTGDGHCTVRELIEAENRARLGATRYGTSLVFIDLECVVTLRAQDLSLAAVPAADREVPIKRVTNQNGAKDNFTVHTPPDPEVAEEARRAARAVGLRLAGIDIVTTDITRSLSETGGALLEVNGGPGLHYHYSVADPANATVVAIPILRTLLT
jgi:D-alanine-D-alanine ligase-like ATP-grasp enzyme